MQILRASEAVQTEVPCPYLQIRRNWFSSYQQMVPGAQHSQSVGHLRKSTAQKAAPFSQAVFHLPELQSRITVLELGTQLLMLICKEGLKHCLPHVSHLTHTAAAMGAQSLHCWLIAFFPFLVLSAKGRRECSKGTNVIQILLEQK